MTDTMLHPSIVSLVSLAAAIASNHPKQGLCQLDKLREHGVSKAQIDTVIDIARHFRDEAGALLDGTFDEICAARSMAPPATEPEPAPAAACCTATKAGTACC